MYAYVAKTLVFNWNCRDGPNQVLPLLQAPKNGAAARPAIRAANGARAPIRPPFWRD